MFLPLERSTDISGPCDLREQASFPWKDLKVAIVHYWLVGMRGGEKVVEALCELFPQAELFTHVHIPSAMSATIARHPVHTSFIARLPGAASRYQRYLPLMPMALEQLDLRGFDLIISSESGPAKGIIPPAGALHLCYCHSPMRYIWNMFHDYRERSGPVTRLLMPPLSHYLRNWDAISATRVHGFAANSRTVARRLHTYYRRDATVIHPPVDTAAFRPIPAAERGDHYLMAGELVAYKRPELAVEAFNRLRKPLIVAGGGEMLGRLRALAGPTVSVLGPQRFDDLRRLYAGCKALVFPGEEDFGIVPVEAMASGRPVLAYRRGGAQSVEAIAEAVARCEATTFDAEAITAHARLFGRDVFKAGMRAFIADSFAQQA